MVEKIQTVATVLSVAVTAIATIIAFIQKTKKEDKNKLVELAKIAQKIPQFINEAEELFGADKGQAKLKYVLKEIQTECLFKNIEYKENQFKVEIENILTTPQKKQKEE